MDGSGREAEEREKRDQENRCERHDKGGMKKAGNRLDWRGKKELAGFKLRFQACASEEQ